MNIYSNTPGTVYYCDKCRVGYRYDLLQNPLGAERYCPNNDCGRELYEVSTSMVPILKHLHKHKIPTVKSYTGFSSAGRPPSVNFGPITDYCKFVTTIIKLNNIFTHKFFRFMNSSSTDNTTIRLQLDIDKCWADCSIPMKVDIQKQFIHILLNPMLLTILTPDLFKQSVVNICMTPTCSQPGIKNLDFVRSLNKLGFMKQSDLNKYLRAAKDNLVGNPMEGEYPHPSEPIAASCWTLFEDKRPTEPEFYSVMYTNKGWYKAYWDGDKFEDANLNQVTPKRWLAIPDIKV